MCQVEQYIPVAQTRPKQPHIWLLFLKAGYKRAVLGTTIFSNEKGHATRSAEMSGQVKVVTFKGGPKYSGWTYPRWSVPSGF